MSEPTLSERLMKVALLGRVPDDDPHVIADAAAEIERLRTALTRIDNESGCDVAAKIAQDALSDEQSAKGTE